MEKRNGHNVEVYEKRPVFHHVYSSNPKYDQTGGLYIAILSEMDAANKAGLPLIIHFQLIKNPNNLKLTRENGLVDLQIPFIPTCYNSFSRDDLQAFICEPKYQERPKALIAQTDPNDTKNLLCAHASDAIGYILFALLNRYKIAERNHDSKTMSLIENLKIITESSLVKNNKDAKHSFDGYHQELERFYKNYNLKSHYEEMLRAIEYFAYYDIDKRHKEEFPRYSIIPRAAEKQ